MKEGLLNAFGFGQLQDFATLLRILADNGISNEQFIAWIEVEKHRAHTHMAEEELRRREWFKQIPKCSACSTPMSLAPVNPEDPGEGSHWTCPRCRFGQYDPRPVMKIEKDLWKKAVPREERRRQRKDMLANTTYGPAGCRGQAARQQARRKAAASARREKARK